MKISYFNSGEFSLVAGETNLETYLEKIEDGKWQDIVLKVRSEQDLEKKKRFKMSAPSVTVSGIFRERRRKDCLGLHSGFLAIDIDKDDNPNLDSYTETLEKDVHCYALHRSIGGFGLVWYVKVSPERHLDAFLAIERYLANQYNITIDPSGKDVTRLRFVSYDPGLYLNKGSKKWTRYILKKDREPIKRVPVVFHDDDIAHVMDQISSGGINIADDYHSWLRIGFALASEFGEQGRDYFHTVSAQSGKYDQKNCDRQYNTSVKRSGDGISIGTFFWYCSQAGIDIKTPETLLIESVGKQRIKQNSNRTEAIASALEYLTEMEGISSERAEPILSQLKKVAVKDLRTEKVDDKVLELENFLKQFRLRHNQITNKVELEGLPINDKDINTIYTMAMRVLDYNIQKAKLWDYIHSDFVPSYNPFMEYFKNNKERKPKGVIKQALACFKIEAPDLSGLELTDDEQTADYLDVFLTRWLVSIISAMHGTYSLLILVLTGGQGSGKTKFFRSLLPDDLKTYYAESKLDAGKDDEILMTQKIIVMDDEFGGKSKVEAKKLKEMSSRESFTVRKPYGRYSEDLKRYAVLCGTSNDSEILNDPTGNRRLIPINLIAFDHKKFDAIDKDDLFMELYHDWKIIGDDWMLTKKEISYLNKATIMNEQPSFEEEMIAKYFSISENEGGKSEFLTCSDIKDRIEKRAASKLNLFKMGSIMKKLGHIRVRKKIQGSVKNVYMVIDKWGKNGENAKDF